MTVASTARRVQFTVGSSGQQGPYAFAFKVLDQADLAVYVGSTTASTLKTLTTHYTVSLSADGTGTITFASGQYPTEAQLVTIIGDKAYARTTDFTAGGDIRAATLNSDGDAQAIFAQQLDENLTRALQVPIFGNRNYTSDGPLLVPYDSTTNNAGKLFAYTAAGNALELTDKAVSAATVSASDVAVTSAGAAGTATATVTLSSAGALAFALGIPIGQTGMMGGVSMQYSTTTADADPGSGFIRFNNATLSSATIMYVDDSDGTTDITAWVQSWDDSNSPNRGYIQIAGNPNTSSPLSIFKVNGAVTDASGYTKIPVAYVAGTTSITNNAEVSVSFAPSGDGDYAGLDYVFSTTTTDSDPGAGTVRLNHATLASVTSIFVDDADANTANVEDYLLSWDDSTNLSDRGLVRVTKKIAPANYALYKISGASTDASGYVKLAVTHVDSDGSFSDADTVAIEFSSSGNIGIPTGLNFTYSTTTTDSDPGSGVIRFNNATLASASIAYVDDADSAGANIEAYVLSWDDSTNTALRGTITLVKRDNPAIFAIWNITGASVDGSGYSKLALTYVAGTGSFANNDPVVLSFVRTGNAGSDASNVFKTISVSGQSDIVADSAIDTLTLANGAGIAITTTAGTDTITIATTSVSADAERAMAGVLQANSNFIDMCLVGPSIDGRAWNGAWSKAGVFSSLMLATIEDEGSNTEINIWDLTEQTSGAISTTPLATVDLSAAATPTSIAAAMGYLIVGSEDGIAIIDPHSGVWAERTAGWPRTLATGSDPALGSNAVSMVAAAVAGTSTFDSRTGGFLPTFAALFASGDAKTGSVIKNDGNVWDILQAAPATGVIGFQDYDLIWPRSATDTRRWEVERLTADMNSYAGNSYVSTVWPQGFAATTAFSASGNHSAWASTSGTSFRLRGDNSYTTGIASITRAYNTGYLVGDIQGAWIANSKTVDRSNLANTLTENGTVTEAAVESGAELMGYSGFSDSTNYLSRAFDADLDFGTANFSAIIWFKRTATVGVQYLWARKSTASAGSNIFCSLADGAHTLRMFIGDGSQATDNTSIPYTGSVWNQLVVTWDGTLGTNSVYLNGVLKNTTTNASVGSLTNSNATLAIGSTDNGTSALDQGSVSLFRLSTYAPSASLIRQMYDGEKPLFVASAECLLQSGSSDSVIDVNVDPLSKKVLVTQTNSISIWEGLAISSKPTVNSGASEKGKLWGDLRAEQNSANAYVTAPATDQRQVNEMVRGLASDLPAGVDLSKAKALLRWDPAVINMSMNIKSVTDTGTGTLDVVFSTPFKSDTGYVSVITGNDGFVEADLHTSSDRFTLAIKSRDVTSSGGASDAGLVLLACFGELENE